ncbi:MAG: helix-turn-helix domain-containing protein [Hydrogenophaga sp.]|nr:helix-turn-helix domain-containing protein [Hydrogenophaga sp.]
MDFFSFEAALLRLKGALQLQNDKDVAAALGMEASAFNKRKARGSFPEEEVRALARAQGFDADYVITGVAQAALEMIQAAREGKPMKKVSAEDAALLSRWHQCTQADQLLLLGLLKRLTGDQPPSLAADGRYPQREEAHPMAVHDKPRKKGA